MVNTGLSGRVALVTGANHGIGAAIAVALAREGARVLVTYLRQSPDVYGVEPEEAEAATVPGAAYYAREIALTSESVEAAIAAFGGVCAAREADLADPQSIPLLFDAAEGQWAGVDILVNNAALAIPDTFLPDSVLGDGGTFVDEYALRTLSAEGHDVHSAVNSRAVALMMAEFARRCIERGGTWGRIINVSTDGSYCHPANVSYGASKHAAESFTRSAAVELGPYGITVNAISPGAVQTGWMPPELERDIAAGYPLRRIGRPDDIADAAVFLASEQAGWITGQILNVGGGNRM
jgi:3-oxoacyl-[acyl-carrier protein] reductase